MGHSRRRQREAAATVHLRVPAGKYEVERVVGRRAGHKAGRVEYQVEWRDVEQGRGRKTKNVDTTDGGFRTWEPREQLVAAGIPLDEGGVAAATIRQEMFAIDIGHRMRLDKEISDMYESTESANDAPANATEQWGFISDGESLLVDGDYQRRCSTRIDSIGDMKAAISLKNEESETNIRPILGADRRLRIPSVAVASCPASLALLDDDTSSPRQLLLPLGDVGSFPHVDRNGRVEEVSDNERIVQTRLSLADPTKYPEVMESRKWKVTSMFAALPATVRRKFKNDPSNSSDYFSSIDVLARQVFGFSDELNIISSASAKRKDRIRKSPAIEAPAPTPASGSPNALVSSDSNFPTVSCVQNSWGVWSSSKFDAIRSATFVGEVAVDDLERSNAAQYNTGTVIIYGIHRASHFDDTSSSSESGGNEASDSDEVRSLRELSDLENESEGSVSESEVTFDIMAKTSFTADQAPDKPTRTTVIKRRANFGWEGESDYLDSRATLGCTVWFYLCRRPDEPTELSSLPLSTFRVVFPQQLIDYLLTNSVILS